MSGTPPLDERYVDWLYSLVSPNTSRNPARSHLELCEYMFYKPFRWFVPNDHNRVEDARELRILFLDEFDINDDDRNWMDIDASVLEVLVALARRVSFESDEAPEFWFWMFLDNLGIVKFKNTTVQGGRAFIDRSINRFVDRTYTATGKGGLFPLKHAREDQRTVEIWYQMSAYLLEIDDAM